MSRNKNLKGRRSVIILIPLLLILLGSGLAFGALTQEPSNKILEKAFKLQMPFIVNEGQIADDSILFYVKTFGGRFM